MPACILIAPADFRAMPWRNGRGRTTEIHVHPAGAGTQHCVPDGNAPIELPQGHALLVEGGAGLVVRPSTSAAVALVATMDTR
jgi:hypothetical protein